MKQKVDDLVAAGFFYTGRGDRAICFHCGLGLNEWEEDDMPWVEHAKWAPDCEFLLLNKGEEFVKECKGLTKKLEDLNVKTETKDGSNGSDKGGERVSAGVDDKVACKICYQKEVGVAFEPCGHTSCVGCAFSLKHCHMCRSPIHRHIKLYI